MDTELQVLIKKYGAAKEKAALAFLALNSAEPHIYALYECAKNAKRRLISAASSNGQIDLNDLEIAILGAEIAASDFSQLDNALGQASAEAAKQLEIIDARLNSDRPLM